MELIFATNNLHKTREVVDILGAGFVVKNLKEAGIMEDIPETADSLQGNALIKARYIFNKYHCNCFADDTGLEIEALDNRPGVFSARYAGENSSYSDNVKKVLKELSGIHNRKACFKTVIALIIDGKEYLFEGRVDGEIIHGPRGNSGFGYDPIFKPNHYNQTFAELGDEIKNNISHRAMAMKLLMEFLSSIQ